MLSGEIAAVCAGCLLAMLVCEERAEGARLPSIPGIQLREETAASSVDGKVQPIVTGVPDGYSGDRRLPLLVGLHTWSAGHMQMVGEYGGEAARRGWLLVCPHFRGPNLASNPAAGEAGGSVLAQHDIIDAIDLVMGKWAVDPDRIYIIGGSGGGHMTALMCTKYPDVFAAGVSYCPITDMAAWHRQQNGYAQHIEAVCGGRPGDSAAVDFEYARRSPRTFITNAAHCNLLLAHGDKDATIWPEQTWDTFRGLRHLPGHRVLFESWSGGHVGKPGEGLDWASEQRRAETPPSRLDLVTDEAKGYFWLHLSPAGELSFGRCTGAVVRQGDATGDGEVAARTELMLRWEQVSRLVVDLRALGLGAPQESPAGVTVEEGRLVVEGGEAGRGEVVVGF